MDKSYDNLLRLNSIVKATDDIYGSMAKKFGISESVFWILYTMRVKNEPITQSDICSAMYQPKQTINTALKNMEANGLITFDTNHNRRSKLVKLTENGTRLAEKTADMVILSEQETLSQFTHEELEEYLRLMKKYCDLLKENTDKNCI